MPLAPIPMQPAFRHGAQTPWGGARLRELYHKDTPDARTGESLEISALRALPSHDAEGTPLVRLVERYGKALVGSEIRGDFPLLLKLLDARERLSLQVHPDEAYAQRHEDKPGKSEAWVILHAEPGAQIVCGLREGVSQEDFQDALTREEGLEEFLRFMPVSAGEAYYLPAGLVHAAGEGILLYELQQASDVTYRIWDWGRRDRHGNRRPLHIRQALDVIQPDLRPQREAPSPLPQEGGRRELLVDCAHFRLERLSACQGAPLLPDRRRFGMLTALQPAVLRYEGRELRLLAGQSALLPALGEDLMIEGEELLYACPALK